MKSYPLLLVSVLPFSLIASAVTASSQDTTPAITAAQVPPAIVQANNQFAFDLFHQISAPSTKNTFFSPYSISTALAMTWAGAQGNTAAEIANAFHFSDLSKADITPDFKLLQQLLADAKNHTGIQLSVANSLWPEKNPDVPFLPDYLKLCETDFASEVTTVDFKNHPDDAATQINQWVEDKTNNKIKDLIHPGDLNRDVRLVLVNAIYFKGSWASPFEERLTKKTPFHLADGTSKSVSMMRQVFEGFSQAEYADISASSAPCQILEMPYFEAQPGADGVARANTPMLSMVIVLPHNQADLDKLEKSLSAPTLAGWLGQMRPGSLEVFLPKFHTEQRFQLAGALAALGVKDAFSSNLADFSGMDGARDLYVSKVIHQAFVDVDEKGTEAAAATAVSFMAGGPPHQEPPPPVFRADHPFLFFIREQTTGSILFMGRVADPTATSTTE